jgi:glyoxylate/hydroxypyruvate reductase A
MALLIEIGHGGWMSDTGLRDTLQAMAPKLDIRTRDTLGDPSDITMAAVSQLKDDLPALLPNLQLVQKLGAGVETIVAHPALAPQVRVARLRPDAPAREIAEWFLAYILREQRHLRQYQTAQSNSEWTSIEPRETLQTVVGVLGLGHIGGRTARMLRDLDFQVHGWGRSAHDIDGVTCHHGLDSLPTMLAQCDYVACILPSTKDTRDLFGPELLSSLKPTATLLNAGRGDLIDEDALCAALDAGRLGYAVLDVLRTEPLPKNSPLWSHPQVTITPHVSGWHLGDALADVVENYHRLCAARPLLNEVDRQKGY